MPKTVVNTVLKKKSGYKVAGKMWIEFEGDKFFGPGPVELLEKIEESGSINKAAREMKMSYKKALKIINNLNGNSSKPFVTMQSGGEQGGGSSITPEAKQMISYHNQMRKRFAAFLKKETELLKTS